MMFKVESEFKLSSDQARAVKELENGLSFNNHKEQTLLGVTGSGKTFTMANIINKVQKPTLVVSHNKTLAAQLYSEFKSFFPYNAVEYFVSYYDYYLPESYIPQTDTYIAKDASINNEIEKLRLSTTASLISRKDVIVVASVSCIYGLGSPTDFKNMSVSLVCGEQIIRKELIMKLVEIQYERNDIAPTNGQFRVRGDIIDVYLSHKDTVIRIIFEDDIISKLSFHEVLGLKKILELGEVLIPPVKNFVLPRDRILEVEKDIIVEMNDRIKYFESKNLFVEAQRIGERTRYDLEMMKEIGYCSGIENYSRHLSGRAEGSKPYCLFDFFPKDYLIFIDESHVTIPQLRAMYSADKNRKQTLVDHGFRLPSALDNRPLKFEEFNDFIKNIIYVSATPADYELAASSKIVEQIIRPTGLLDPIVETRQLDGQIDDVIEEVKKRTKIGEKSIVITLTKKSSEKLSEYLNDIGIKNKYLHSDIDTVTRVEILNSLRRNEYECLIGVNLLREGLDLPEVSFLAILDGDREGFLRSEKALIQIAGRAARHINGTVVIYADKITPAIEKLISITKRRRTVQVEYNKANGIIPKSIKKEIRNDISAASSKSFSSAKNIKRRELLDKNKIIEELEAEMIEAANMLEFERAIHLRDKIRELKSK